MPSQILDMLKRNALPFQVLGKIIGDVAKEERKLLEDGGINQDVAKFLDRDIQCSAYRRTWGSVKGDVIGLDSLQKNGVDFLRINTEWDDSDRGCHNGTYNETVIIPDALVKAYESVLKVIERDSEYPPGIISDKMKEYKRQLRNHVEKVAVELRLKFFEADEADRKKKKELEQQTQEETEAKERLLLQELLKKYPQENRS